MSLIAIELGGTWLRSARIVDGFTRDYRQTKMPKRGGSQEVLMDLLHAIENEIWSLSSIDALPSGLAVSCAGRMTLRPNPGARNEGPVETRDNDVLVTAFQIGLEDFLLQRELERRFPHLCVHLENDTNAAARSVVGMSDVAVITLGTGVSLSVIKGGKVQRLPGYWGATEVGHEFEDIVPSSLRGFVDEEDRNECTCGRIGCLEATIGGWALARYGTSPGKVLKYVSRVLDATEREFGVHDFLLHGGVATGLNLARDLADMTDARVDYTQFDAHSGLVGVAAAAIDFCPRIGVGPS